MRSNAKNNRDEVPPKPNLVEYDDDGKPTKDTVKRAMKAFRKRLKLARLDQESSLGRDPLSKGEASSIVAVQPPEQYPPEVWEHLAETGRLKKLDRGLYQLALTS